MIDAQASRLVREASQLFHAGRFAEAVPVYERLLELHPDLPDSWFNLAFAQRRQRRFYKALGAYAEALARGITRPEEVHLQRAVIFSDDLSRSDAARAELTQALALNPHYIPALLNIGNLHEDVGERDAARGFYTRVLALEPGQPLALARLIGLAEICGSDDPLVARAALILDDVSNSTEDRADVGFALGAALDRLGAYDAAFAAFATANRITRAKAASDGVRYDRAQQEALIDNIIATFSSATPRDGPSPAETPLFICGMFRSGSTLTEQILARHDRVVAGGEMALPELIAHHLTPYPAGAGSRERRAAVRDAYLREVANRRRPDRLLVDKQPDNFLHVGLVKVMFPRARFVHTVRNPRDNCLSIYFLHAHQTMAYATDLGDIAHRLCQEQRLMQHWRALYPDDIFELDYDRLVEEPATTIAALLRFCGLPWQDEVLSPHLSTAAVRTASNWQVRRPLYRDSSGRWQHYRRHLRALDDALLLP